jgi:hypothetical protein
MLGPEPERVRAVGQLDKARVLLGLAGLGDQRRHDVLGMVDQPLAGPAQDPPAALEAERFPRRLGGAGAGDHRGDIIRHRYLADDLAGRRVLDRDGRLCLFDGGHRAQTSPPALPPRPLPPA